MRNPELDGIDHINIYSKGQTELGQLLSNFAHVPMNINEHGHFESVEGYWYWLGCRNDRLRLLYGYKAKELGKTLKQKISLNPEEFKKYIRRAINTKIVNSPTIKKQFICSVLPFDHYYVYDGIAKDAGFKWIIEHLENIRGLLKRS